MRKALPPHHGGARASSSRSSFYLLLLAIFFLLVLDTDNNKGPTDLTATGGGVGGSGSGSGGWWRNLWQPSIRNGQAPGPRDAIIDYGNGTCRSRIYPRRAPAPRNGNGAAASASASGGPAVVLALRGFSYGTYSHWRTTKTQKQRLTISVDFRRNARNILRHVVDPLSSWSGGGRVRIIGATHKHELVDELKEVYGIESLRTTEEFPSGYKSYVCAQLVFQAEQALALVDGEREGKGTGGGTSGPKPTIRGVVFSRFDAVMKEDIPADRFCDDMVLFPSHADFTSTNDDNIIWVPSHLLRPFVDALRARQKDEWCHHALLTQLRLQKVPVDVMSTVTHNLFFSREYLYMFREVAGAQEAALRGVGGGAGLVLNLMQPMPLFFTFTGKDNARLELDAPGSYIFTRGDMPVPDEPPSSSSSSSSSSSPSPYTHELFFHSLVPAAAERATISFEIIIESNPQQDKIPSSSPWIGLRALPLSTLNGAWVGEVVSSSSSSSTHPTWRSVTVRDVELPAGSEARKDDPRLPRLPESEASAAAAIGARLQWVGWVFDGLPPQAVVRLRNIRVVAAAGAPKK